MSRPDRALRTSLKTAAVAAALVAPAALRAQTSNAPTVDDTGYQVHVTDAATNSSYSQAYARGAK